MTRWKCCLGRLLDRWKDTTLLHGLKVGSFKDIFLSFLSQHILLLSRPMQIAEMIFPCAYCRETFPSNHLGFPLYATGQGVFWSFSSSLACRRETSKSNHWVSRQYVTGQRLSWPLSPPLWPSQATLPTSFTFSSLLPTGDPILTILLAGVESP